MHNIRLAEGAKTEPFLEVCSAKAIISDDLIECLVTNPTCIKYYFGFGNGKMCKHPLKAEIAARSRERKEADKK